MFNCNLEKIIEFNRIKDMWKMFAHTDFAKESIENIEPYMSELELICQLDKLGLDAKNADRKINRGV